MCAIHLATTLLYSYFLNWILVIQIFHSLCNNATVKKGFPAAKSFWKTLAIGKKLGRTSFPDILSHRFFEGFWQLEKVGLGKVEWIMNFWRISLIVGNFSWILLHRKYVPIWMNVNSSGLAENFRRLLSVRKRHFLKVIK